MIVSCSFCNCCSGCSSKRQLSTNFRNSFPKKLLIAIAIVVIIAMFITPSEAGPVMKHRHGCKTKDCHSTRSANLKILQRQKTKDNIRRNLYREELGVVIAKLRNTKSKFHYTKEKDLKYYDELPPSWLPKVNFTEIHYHHYNRSKDRKQNMRLREEFKYVMPKLYKSLREYQALFKAYQNMYLDFPDTLKNSYHKKRKDTLKNATEFLAGTIGEVRDSMIKVDMPVRLPRIKDFSNLPTTLSNIEDCFIYDFLAFRGYLNLLKNWLSELRCMKNPKRNCTMWEKKLRNKSLSVAMRQQKT